MNRNRVFLLSLLLFPALSQAEEEEAQSFQDVTLAVLGEQVKDFGSAYAQAVVEQLAQESGLEADEVRAELKELLVELEGHRKGKTEVWDKLVARRSEEVEEKLAEPDVHGPVQPVFRPHCVDDFLGGIIARQQLHRVAQHVDCKEEHGHQAHDYKN